MILLLPTHSLMWCLAVTIPIGTYAHTNVCLRDRQEFNTARQWHSCEARFTGTFYMSGKAWRLKCCEMAQISISGLLISNEELIFILIIFIYFDASYYCLISIKGLEHDWFIIFKIFYLESHWFITNEITTSILQ